MRMPPFDPAELRPIANFVKEGKIPMKLDTLRRKCGKGGFPSVWINKGWYTTEGAIRAYMWQHANHAFKKITS